MSNIGGINNFGGLQGPGKNEGAKPSEPQTPVNNFNPNAQVMSPLAQSQAAAMARLQMNKAKKSSAVGEDERNENGDYEIDVETIGLIKINDEQLERFKERVRKGVLRQEQEIVDAVNTFAGSEENLRNIIGSIMMSHQ